MSNDLQTSRPSLRSRARRFLYGLTFRFWRRLAIRSAPVPGP